MTGYCYLKEEIDEPCVLFKDYNGVYAPLVSLYWSTSSKVLASRHPVSCIEEIVSYFCPQCMTRYVEIDALQHKMRCPVCQQCPVCAGVLLQSHSSTAESTSLRCSSCHWIHTSESSKYEQIEQFQTPQYQKILRFLTDKAKKGASEITIEEDRTEISEYLAKKHKGTFFVNIESDEGVDAADYTNNIQRMRCNENATLLSSSLTPCGVRLRTKRLVRCRKDVQENKMSILVQPKPAPLEGDSSMKISRGKWWIKDSSAPHFVPSIVLTKLPTFSELATKGYANLEIFMSNSRDVEVAIELFSNAGATRTEEMSMPPFDFSVCGLEASRYSSMFSENDVEMKSLSVSTSEHPEATLTEGGERLDAASSVAGYLVKLAAYEDELLRGDDDDKSTQSKSVTAEEEVRTQNESGMAKESGGQPDWKCFSSHNTAHLTIPVKIADMDWVPPTVSEMGGATVPHVFHLPMRAFLQVVADQKTGDTAEKVVAQKPVAVDFSIFFPLYAR